MEITTKKNGENILIENEILIKLIIVVIVSTAHCGPSVEMRLKYLGSGKSCYEEI